MPSAVGYAQNGIPPQLDDHISSLQKLSPEALATVLAAVKVPTSNSQPNGISLPSHNGVNGSSPTMAPVITPPRAPAVSLPGSGPPEPAFGSGQIHQPGGDNDIVSIPKISTTPNEQKNPISIISKSVTAARDMKASQMTITSLGAQLISSSETPVAMVNPPRDPVMSTTQTAVTLSQATGAASELANQTKAQVLKPLPTIKVDATAPQQKDHAKLWSDAIQAAKSSSGVNVNGATMSNLGLATIGADGSMVKMPLAQALTTTAGQPVQVDKATAPAALSSAAAVAAVDEAASKTPTIAGTVAMPTEAASVPVPAAISAAQDAADPAAATPPGFVLSGDIKLFGNLEAERYVYQGTAATDGKAEMVTFVQQPVALDDVFQGSGVSFGKIMLNKPSISYYDGSVQGKQTKGIWLDAGILLGDVAPDAASDAATLFGHDQANQLAITIGLGGYSSWSAALKPPTDLTIKASLPNVSGKLGKHLEFTSAEITLVAAKSASATTTTTTVAKSTYSWDVSFAGTVLFTAPSSITPLHMDFTMKKTGTAYDLELRMNKEEDWTTAMGVPGMNLTDVTISTTYDTAKKDSLAFKVDGHIVTTSMDLTVQGDLKDDEFELSAVMNGYTWQNLDDLFHKMFGSPLQQTKHDITFQQLTLNISSKDRDLKLTGKINVDNWLKDLNCEIDVSSQGFHLTAKVVSMQCLDVTLQDATIALFVGKQGDVDPSPKTAGTAMSFRADGSITFHGEELTATAYFDKDGSNNLIWALYAQLKPADPSHPPAFSLSKLFNMGNRSDLDLVLENFVVTASNSSTLGDLMPQDSPYKIKQGVNLFAKVDCPTAITKALNTKPASVTLELDLGATEKKVSLVFDSPQHMNLKPGMSSSELQVGIDFTDPAVPKLFVEADLTVQLGGQPAPSVFGFNLTVDVVEAELSAHMATDWVDPFNLSPNVKILGPVALGAEIIYVSPIYPSGLEFTGGLQVGETKGKAAFKVTTSPKEGVLLIEVDDLGVKDIISFASLVIEHTIPQPKSDFLRLQKLKLGLSTGASIGDVYYPAGVTYDAEMQLFGKNATVKAEISKDDMHLYGEVDAFTLGPLTVAGNTGKSPTVDLRVSKDSQKLSVDGNIRLWDVDAGITIVAGLDPLDLDFDTKLVFGELLDFELHADVVGKVDNFKDLMKSDFTFSASLEQHILDYFMAHANTYVLAAKHGVETDTATAQAKLAAAKQSYMDYINKQQAAVDDAKLKWDRQNQSVCAAADAKKAQIKAQTAAKQAAVDAAKAKLDAFIQSLEKKLSDSKAAEAAEVAKAQNNVNAEKARVDADVNGKVAKLQQAQASLQKSFGSADNALNTARAKVQNAQNDLNSVQQKLNNAKSDLSHASFFTKVKYAAEVVAFGTEFAAAEAAFKVAQGVLVAAEAVVNGVGYKMANEAVSLAETALNDAKKAADLALNDVNKALSETQKLQAGLVDAANIALAEAQKECDQSKAWDAAKALLKAAIDAEATVVADAIKTVNALATCVEKVAYDAACAALALARAGTKEIDLANSALEFVKDSSEAVLSLSSWMIAHAGNVFNIRSVQLSGSLGAAAKKMPLSAHIEGEFCDAAVKLDVDFVPGKAEDMMKATFEKIMSEMKGNIEGFVKKEGLAIVKKL